jgi:hypothetical protein
MHLLPAGSKKYTQISKRRQKRTALLSVPIKWAKSKDSTAVLSALAATASAQDARSSTLRLHK